MKLRSALLVLLLASSAHAGTIRFKTGSWGYEYPTDWFVKPDGQNIVLTGSRGFSFHGVIADYWVDANRCQAHAEIVPCPPNTMRVNWYAGSHNKGVGLLGVAMLNGKTYPNVGAPGSSDRIRFQTNGTIKFPPLGMDGSTKVKMLMTPITGSFVHGGVTESIVGDVVVTVEFEQENDEWEVENIEYDLEVESD